MFEKRAIVFLATVSWREGSPPGPQGVPASSRCEGAIPLTSRPGSSWSELTRVVRAAASALP
jgi:hypothetical protein